MIRNRNWFVGGLLLLLAACAPENRPAYQGYAEGEYVKVAAPFAGSLTALHVKRGDQANKDMPLFSLEQENEAAAHREAQERMKRAEAQLADLQKGKRPSEIAAIQAQLAQARATLKLSTAQFKRQQELVAQKFVSPDKVDEARSAYERDQARVEELSAQLKTAHLTARDDEIRAAKAEAAAARAALAQAEWKLAQKSVTTPVAGLVADTLYVQGEWVPAGSPVVSLLPPQNIKVRFFVPETEIARIRINDTLQLSCDGCQALTAQVNYISPQAEYTPPVIYSKDSRAKLVYLVEARPRTEVAALLHPGQPLDVWLQDSNKTGAR
ncbi:MAG: HlyD family secretion protein [Burkholderiales bacterium]